MMAVIVDDDRAVDLADLAEAALDAVELREAGDDVASSGIPSSSATAMAASAFWTLWRPGIGTWMLPIVRRSPSRPRITASKRLPPGTGTTLSARMSASAENP